MNKYVSEEELTEHAEAREGRRVTMADVENAIEEEFYFTAAQGAMIGGTEPHPLDMLTFCVLLLKNGFTVTGQSACADPKMYDWDIGCRVARGDALRQVWPLLGFQLREELYQEASSANS